MMNIWRKKGPIYATPKDKWWNKSHTQCPVVELDCHGHVRAYFGTRDNEMRSRIGYVCVAHHNFHDIMYVADEPIIKLGKPGWFDSDGMTPSCLVNYKHRKYLYYQGWNRGHNDHIMHTQNVRYRCGIGVLVSDDHGLYWRRVFNGPILDRNIYDPITASSPCVLTPDDTGYEWRMYYTSYTKWEEIDGVMEPFYNVKLATSEDGLNWTPKGITCLNLKGDEGGIAKVHVIYENGYYKMWYPVRNKTGYRNSREHGYRIRYATSRAGIVFERGAESHGLDPSDMDWNFDNEMAAYPYIFKFDGKTYMFYNGNGFGQGGIGYAVREDIK